MSAEQPAFAVGASVSHVLTPRSLGVICYIKGEVACVDWGDCLEISDLRLLRPAPSDPVPA